MANDVDNQTFAGILSQMPQRTLQDAIKEAVQQERERCALACLHFGVTNSTKVETAMLFRHCAEFINQNHAFDADAPYPLGLASITGDYDVRLKEPSR